jgi:hypothetical protein
MLGRLRLLNEYVKRNYYVHYQNVAISKNIYLSTLE